MITTALPDRACPDHEIAKPPNYPCRVSDTRISGGPDAGADHPPVEGDVQADDDAGSAGPGPVARLRESLSDPTGQLVLLVVAVLGIVGTLVFFFLWRGERSDDARADDARETAEEFLTSLLEFDGATINEDFDRILEFGTGEFLLEAEDFYADPELRQALGENQVASRWEPKDIFVQSVEGDTARVFAVGDQTIANNQTPEPVRDEVRIEIGLVHEDGDWKVFDLAVLEAPADASGPGFVEPNATTTTTTTPG